MTVTNSYLHQRYLACKELGIELIPTIIREELVDEDLKLRQLIASNFGRLSNNPTKYRKAVAEYTELVGYKKGDNQHSATCTSLSQSEIAKELGITTRELQRILVLENNLIPELQQEKMKKKN